MRTLKNIPLRDAGLVADREPSAILEFCAGPAEVPSLRKFDAPFPGQAQDPAGSDRYPIAILRERCELHAGNSDFQNRFGNAPSHDFTDLVLVIAGQGIHQRPDERIPVSAGNVFVRHGQPSHGFCERNQLELITVRFDPDRLELPVELLQQISGYRALFGPTEFPPMAPPPQNVLRLNRSDLGFAKSLTNRMEKEMAVRSEGHQIVLFALLIELIIFLSRRVEHTDSTEAKASLRIGQLLGRLEREFRESWTVEQMARTSNLSRGCLIRTFRKATGQTPTDYLIRLRIESSMNLLQRTDLSVTEIALNSGFSDGNYFARQFRRVCGCSASDFRREAMVRE